MEIVYRPTVFSIHGHVGFLKANVRNLISDV